MKTRLSENETKFNNIQKIRAQLKVSTKVLTIPCTYYETTLIIILFNWNVTDVSTL